MSVSTASYLAWALLGASFLVLAMAARLRHGVARFGQLVTALAARPPLRAALILGWMWLGWHAFAR